MIIIMYNNDQNVPTLIVKHQPVGFREKWENLEGTRRELKLLKEK